MSEGVNPPADQQPPQATGAPHVTWHGPLVDLSGYASVARLVVTALDACGTVVIARPIYEALPKADDV